MKLSHVTIGQVTTGHVINLASNDVQRFDPVRLIINGLITFQFIVMYFFHPYKAFAFIHQLWISPLVFVVFIYLLYINVGSTGFIAMVVVILVVPLQVSLTRLYSRMRFVFDWTISSIPLWTSILLPLVQTYSFPFMPSTPSIPPPPLFLNSPLLPPLHPSPPFPLLPPLPF